MEEWGDHPIVKNSDPYLFMSERTAETKMEKSMRKRWSSEATLITFNCDQLAISEVQSVIIIMGSIADFRKTW